MLRKFNIRVYGLLIEDKSILVVDELVKGKPVTKFPGGGLELGEGPLDCLIREFKEETGLDILVKEHFYTTDFFQQSAFNPDDQIISIYYLVENSSSQPSVIPPLPFENQQASENILAFRWINIHELTVEQITLPIDKIVTAKLIEAYRH